MDKPIINPSTLSEQQRKAIREEWRDIPNYEELYQISNLGRIMHKPTIAIGGKGYCNKNSYFRIPRKTKGGYCAIELSKNAVTKSYLVHRLVALAFIPNPNNYRCVNHINCVRDDNRVENLEWCTHSYNTRYAFSLGRMSKSPKSGQQGRKVKAIRVADNETFIFPNMQRAAAFLNVENSTIRYHLVNNSPNCKGYKLYDFKKGE